MSQSKVRNLQALGENLQLVAKALMEQQTLMRYLYYTDKDPLNPNKSDVKPEDIFSSHIKIIPVVDVPEKDHSMLSIIVVRGDSVSENTEFIDIVITIEVFVPMTQWILKSNNLRPYLIMGEISKALKGLTINGLGKIDIINFQANFFTEEMSAFKMLFTITQYN